MNASDLLKYQMNDAGYQLGQVLKDVRDADLDFRISGDSMSMRQTVGHLSDAYLAMIASLEGRKYDWGSYVPPTDAGELLKACFDLRDQAVNKILGAGTDEALQGGSQYIVAHDFYHVGQLAATRIASEPGWDAYSIYQMG